MPGDVAVLEATRGAQHLARRLDQSGATVLLLDSQQCRLVGFRGKKMDYRDCLARSPTCAPGTCPSCGGRMRSQQQKAHRPRDADSA